MIRHHLANLLKTQYLNEFNPRVLWDALKTRFDHLREISLPIAKHNWTNLHVQDHKLIAEYNGELLWITSQLAVCGHLVDDLEKIEKTLLTFHATNLIIASQYRNMAFTKYSELIAHMLLAERHQVLLLENAKA